MPLYEFQCTNCNLKKDIKLSFKEHAEKKELQECTSCGNMMIQVVAPLRFTLKGYGWYASDYTQGIDPHGITDTEIQKNLDEVKRVEEQAANFDANIGEF